MSTDDLDIHIRLKGARAAAGDAKKVRAEVVGMGNAAERTGRKTRSMGRGFVYARKGIGPLRAGVTGLTGALGFGAGIGLIGAFKVANDEARDAQKTNRSTAAVLKSTGGAANVTQGHVYKLGQRLGEVAAVDNQVVQKGENMLLTFRDIRNEQGKGNRIFDRTTKAALNLAAGFTAAGKEMSPTEAALQLGKAVNDPVKGMTRLQRIGVTFTKQQTDQVAAMVKNNNTLGAQKVILKEIGKEFGGQARSQADPVKRLNVIFRDLAETIGLKMLPYIDKAARAVGKWVQQVTAGTGQGGRFRDKVEQIWKAAKPVVFWFGRAAANVFKFASHHAGLVKVATALFLVSKALKLMRFGSAIKGAQLLWTWLGRAETRATTMPGRLKGRRSAFASAGTILGGVFAASYIAQLTGIEDADPLLFLHPPAAGGPAPKRNHGKVVGHFIRDGLRWNRYADGTVISTGDVDTGRPGVNTHHRSVDRGPRGVNPSIDRGPRGVNPKAYAGPAPAMAAEGDIIHHTVVQIGDRPVWEAYERHDRKKANRR